MIGKPERHTQNRVIALFRDELKYRYLGGWSDRANSNIDDALATTWLKKAGYSAEQISRALYLLRTEADNLTREPSPLGPITRRLSATGFAFTSVPWSGSVPAQRSLIAPPTRDSTGCSRP